MKVLLITNMVPSKAHPRNGTFVEQQINGLLSMGLDGEVLHLDRAGSGMFVYRRAKAMVREVIDRFHPDVIHSLCGGVPAFLIQRGVGDIPFVVSFGGTDLLGAKEELFLKRLRIELGVWCSRQVGARATWIVVKSRNLLDVLPSAKSHSNVSIIPNGVNLSLFRPMNRDACLKQLVWSPLVFNVLFVTGKMGGPNKRLSLAASAVQRLQTGGIVAKLRVMTSTPHEEVPIWLNAADVLVLTSMHEGSPNIVKEALACNRPVVSVDVGDVRERISDIHGCYLAKADPEDLALKLKSVFKGPREVESRKSMQDLSIEAVARRLVTVYEAAIASKGLG